MVCNAIGVRAQKSLTIDAELEAGGFMPIEAADDEGLRVPEDPILDRLNQEAPQGLGDIMYARNKCVMSAMLLQSYRDPKAEIIFMDCPEDASHRSTRHVNLRGKTNQIILIPIQPEQYACCVARLDEEDDLDLFRFDPQTGWVQEEDVKADFLLKLEAA